jgi:hypothetical protein
MSGNGTDSPLELPVPGSKAEAQITFVFGANGDLKRIDGTVTMVQLIMVAFEATQLASGAREQIMMKGAMDAAERQRIVADLERERKRGR